MARSSMARFWSTVFLSRDGVIFVTGNHKPLGACVHLLDFERNFILLAKNGRFSAIRWIGKTQV